MSDLGFLTDHAWLDEDGIHVWSAHDCLNGEPGHHSECAAVSP